MVKKWEDWGVGDSCRMEREREKGRKTAKKRGLEVRGGKNRLEILRVPKEKGMHSVVNRTLKALT